MRMMPLQEQVTGLPYVPSQSMGAPQLSQLMRRTPTRTLPDSESICKPEPGGTTLSCSAVIKPNG